MIFCLNCGKPIDGITKRKFCSLTCSGMYHRASRRAQKLCIVCGNPIDKPNAWKYCSPECYKASHTKAHHAYCCIPVSPDKPCEICGKPIGKGRKKFCSKACLEKYVGITHRRNKVRPCANCGKPIDSTRVRFCCDECRIVAYKESSRRSFKSDYAKQIFKDEILAARVVRALFNLERRKIDRDNEASDIQKNRFALAQAIVTSTRGNYDSKEALEALKQVKDI